MRVGTDLVHVPRLAEQIELLGSSFLDRVFTPGEQRECAGDVQRLACRWAAKEATIPTPICQSKPSGSMAGSIARPSRPA